MARLAIAATTKPARMPPAAVIRIGAREYLMGWLSLTLIIAAVTLCMYLVQMSVMATTGYDLQRLEAEREVWLARNEQLQYELAKRRSLAWVEAQAVERLGMVRPERPAPVVAVDPSAVPATGWRGADGVGPRPNVADNHGFGAVRTVSSSRARQPDLSIFETIQSAVGALRSR